MKIKLLNLYILIIYNCRLWRPHCYIVIAVNTKERLAFGATATDTPERPQFTMPTYSIDFRKVEEVTEKPSDSLPIGLLKIKGEHWELLDYQPPCVHLEASKSLRDKYLDYQEALQKLLAYIPGVIQQTDSYQDRATLELREFCMQTGSYLAQQSANYWNLKKHGSPYEMIKLWCGFASLAAFLLRCLKEDARREFYNLLEYNTHGVAGLRFNPNYFESFLQEFALFKFQQNDIMTALKKTDELQEMIVPLFRTLSTNYTWTARRGYIETRVPESPKPLEKVAHVVPEKSVVEKKKSDPFSFF